MQVYSRRDRKNFCFVFAGNLKKIFCNHLYIHRYTTNFRIKKTILKNIIQSFLNILEKFFGAYFKL